MGAIVRSKMPTLVLVRPSVETGKYNDRPVKNKPAYPPFAANQGTRPCYSERTATTGLTLLAAL